MLNDNIHHLALEQLNKACKKAADDWAEKTKIGELVNKLGATTEDRKVLMMFAKQCFTEGMFQGSMRTMEGVMSMRGKPNL